MKALRLAAYLLPLVAFAAPGICDPAIGYGVSAPLTQENLSVYFVRGNSGGPAPLTLDQALNQGAAQVRWTRNNPITVENLSDHSVFVPFGMLLTGGLQDQVTGTSVMLPPHSGPIPLATFCVDPFRTTARVGESPDTLASPGAMMPGQTAKLAMLANAPGAKATGLLRQAGVWWNIDTTRAALTQSLGEPMEPARVTRWDHDAADLQMSTTMLADRQSKWLTSLPLALENRTLVEAERAYVGGLEGAAGDAGIIGAVFAINGRLQNAEIYQSHALFAEMWPKLLRSHAVEAIAAKDGVAERSPGVGSVEAFLAAAEAGTIRQRTHGDFKVLRDSDTAVYAETATRDGAWINRSIQARPDGAAAAPDAMIVRMLESGHVNGRPIARLGADELPVMHRDAAGGWSMTMQEFGLASALREAFGGGLDGGRLVPALFGLTFLAFMVWVTTPVRERRRRVESERFASAFAASPVRYAPAAAVAIPDDPRFVRAPASPPAVTRLAAASGAVASAATLWTARVMWQAAWQGGHAARHSGRLLIAGLDRSLIAMSRQAALAVRNAGRLLQPIRAGDFRPWLRSSFG